MSTALRPAAVAGLFYPSDPTELRASVQRTLADAPEGNARVVVAPHAGHEFSGHLAARAVAALDPGLERIAVLGPNHRVPYRGMCTPGAELLATPLGEVAVWEPVAIPASERVHRNEHCIEVELPFIQVRFPRASVFPVVVAEEPEPVAELIRVVLEDPKAGLIISSDMSHFLPAGLAERTDAQTLAAVAEFQQIGENGACVRMAWDGLTRYAASCGLAPEVLGRAHSGEVSGDNGSVVGYAAVAYRDVGEQLPALARAAIKGEQLDLHHPWLRCPGASFVTLTQNGRLRGCIGALEAYQPLAEDVAAHARAAAFGDPRFPPLGPDESFEVEVSVLCPQRSLGRLTYEEALQAIRPGLGVTLGGGATFLPQVWEELPEPRQFLDHLVAKADWRSWPDPEVFTYTVRSWHE